MDTTKPWWASVTIWGALVSLIVFVARIFGLHPDDAWSRDATDLLVNLAGAVASAVAIWGRLRATRKIGSAAGLGPRTPLWCFLLVLLAWGAAGCSPAAPYVAADNATYQAIAPEYQAYFNADPALTADQKALRQRTLDTWKLRTTQAQKAATQPATRPGN